MSNYIINYSGGTITLTPGNANVETGLTFMGQNYSNYGGPLNQNWLSLMENFASNVTAPNLAVKGMLWYDSANSELKLNVDNGVANWRYVVTTSSVNGNVTFDSVAANFISGDGSNISNINASSITSGSLSSSHLSGSYNIDISGVANAANYADNITVASQPNITSLGTLTTLAVSGNTSTGNLTTTGQANVVGDLNVTGTITGNFSGNISGTITMPGSNTQVIYNNQGNAGASANFTFNGNTLTVAGNVNATNLSGNGASISNITGANVTGAVAYATVANSVAAANVSGTVANATHAINADNATNAVLASVSVNITASAQPNITSLGTLTGLNVNGNIVAGNITANTGIFTGNGAGLTNLAGANVTGTVANAAYATNAGNAVNATNATNAVNATTAGTVTTAAQPNITSLGTLSSLEVTGNLLAGNANITTDARVGGNLNVDGTITGNIQGNISGNFAVPGANTQVLYNDMGNAGASPNLTFNGTTLNVVGTVDATTLAGNGSGLSGLVGANVTGAVAFATTANSVAGANVTGQVANALVAGTVYTNAQPNITSVGTLSNLAVSGNISAANISVTGLIQGNGAGLTGLEGANVSGTVANATYAANAGTAALAVNVTSASQPNITSLGNLTTLIVNGNLQAGNSNTGALTAVTLSGNGAGLTNITGANVTGEVANANYASFANVAYNITGANIVGEVANANYAAFAGTAYSVAAANITGVVANANYAAFAGTAYSVSGANVTGVVANANYAAFAGTAYSVSGANVTTEVANANFAAFANTAYSVSGANVTGEVANANFAAFANTAYGVSGANVTGEVANANYASFANVAYNITGANIVGEVANANYAAFAGTAYSVSGANVTGTVANATHASTANTVTTAAQPNITSLGTLTGLTVNGNLTTSNANITANATVGGNLTVSGTIIGNVQGNISGNIAVTGSNTEVLYNNQGNVGASSNFTFNGTTLNVAGNANATVFNGSGAGLTNIPGANVTGTVANATYATSAGSATTAGTVTTAAQPNITSVGTLTALTVSGNANVGNIGATDGVFTGNVTANNLSTTNKVTAGNGLQVTTGPVDILAGNLNVTGNINVTGNLNYSNVTDLVVGDPLIYIGANNTGDVVDLGIVASYNDGVYEHTGLARNAADNIWTFFDGVVAEPTTVIDWANAIYPTVKLGNLIATGTANITGNANVGNIGATNGVFTNVSGNGSALTGLNASNITTGTLDQSRLANSNITVNGTAISLGGSGTITANTTQTLTFGNYLTGTSFNGGTANTIAVDATSAATANKVVARDANGSFAANVITANTFSGIVIGDGANLANLNASNISSGTLAQARLANSSLTVNGTSITLGGSGTITANTTQSHSNGAYITGGSFNGGSAVTWAVDATDAATANKIVARDANGSFSANIITANSFNGPFTGNGANLTNLNASNITTGTLAQARLANANLTLGTSVATLGGTQANIVGLTNLGATTVTASTLVSNVATGTAPLTVSSTTRVSNLNVAYANVADFVNVLNGSNASAVYSPMVTETVTTGNTQLRTLGNEILFYTNGNIVSNGVITANSFSGPFTGNGANLTNLNASNITTGTLAQARLANSTITLNGTTLTLGGTSTVTANTTQIHTNGSYITGGTFNGGTAVTWAVDATDAATASKVVARDTNGSFSANVITANLFSGPFTGNGANLTNLNASNITSGTLAQARLANSSLTVNGTSISLGGSGTVTANTSQNHSNGAYLTGGSFNGGTAITWAVDATDAATGSKVVARDANGSFSANVVNSTFTLGSVQTGISANGSTQATATALTKQYNVVSTVTAGQGVVLPAATAGMRLTVINTATANLLVYPASTAQINSLGANVAFTLGGNTNAMDLVAVSGTQWYIVNAIYT